MHARESAKKFRIGFLDTGQSVAVPKLLTDLGYIDGQNAVFEHRASRRSRNGWPRWPLEVRALADYDSVFAPLTAKPIGALVMFTDPLTWANWKRAADFKGKSPPTCLTSR